MTNKPHLIFDAPKKRVRSFRSCCFCCLAPPYSLNQIPKQPKQTPAVVQKTTALRKLHLRGVRILLYIRSESAASVPKDKYINLGELSLHPPGSQRACSQGEEIGSTAAALQPKRPHFFLRLHPSCSLSSASLCSGQQDLTCARHHAHSCTWYVL